MAAIAGEVSKQIKGHSEGEMGFRPWWDTMEDNLLYAFVILGMITLPMTFFSKTPIECTPHHNLWHNDTNVEARGLSRFFPKVYCTEMMIEPFLLYLPFTLLMVPIVLTFIEKTFVKIYNVEQKMNQFYLLLVKESLEREDVSSLEKENIKDCHEIEQVFKTSNDCYLSYLYRTSLEIVGSVLLAGLFSLYHGTYGIGVPFFDCNVYGYYFECLVPNSQFFYYVYILSFIFIGGYFFCSLYNFIWIVVPRVGKLSGFLAGCQKQSDSYLDELTDDATKMKMYGLKPSVRLKLYFKPDAHDFQLLINLLAESAGLPEAIRILALFEHHFGMLWEAEDIRLVQKAQSSMHLNITEDKEANARKKLQSLMIYWNDCSIAEYFYSHFKRSITMEYTVEISPETEAPIKSVLYYRKSDWQYEELQLLTQLDENDKLNTVGSNVSHMGQPHKYSASFDGLEPEKTYKITLSTELNGRTIIQTSRDFVCMDA